MSKMRRKKSSNELNRQSEMRNKRYGPVGDLFSDCSLLHPNTSLY